jgi:hypothetical protein
LRTGVFRTYPRSGFDRRRPTASVPLAAAVYIRKTHLSNVKHHESLLQKVIDDRPNILPIREFYPGVANLFSLGREIPVETGSGQGFIDNLLVTDDGRLVLVETKLWRNPQALREVVAQTLQYGMALSQCRQRNSRISLGAPILSGAV